MTVLVTIIHVWPTMVIEVLTRAFDAIMISLTLDIFKFLRRCVPASRLSIT
jgi:hypothetical protein